MLLQAPGPVPCVVMGATGGLQMYESTSSVHQGSCRAALVLGCCKAQRAVQRCLLTMCFASVSDHIDDLSADDLVKFSSLDT